MNTLLKKIRYFFKSLWNIKTNLRFRRINKKLYKTIEDREVDRIILKGRIVKMVKEYVAINTASKFIPPWFKSNAEIREEVIHKYGKEMDQLGIKLYRNLKLSA